MRGKLLQGKYALESNRITPAGAGKTATDIGTNMTAQDHPRRCGENYYSSPGFVRDCLGMCATSFEAETLLTMAAETLGQNYTVEQYFFPEGQVDWWAGLIKEYFYYVYDLRRASDRIYRIIYEELYISGYDD